MGPKWLSSLKGSKNTELQGTSNLDYLGNSISQKRHEDASSAEYYRTKYQCRTEEFSKTIDQRHVGEIELERNITGHEQTFAFANSVTESSDQSLQAQTVQKPNTFNFSDAIPESSICQPVRSPSATTSTPNLRSDSSIPPKSTHHPDPNHKPEKSRTFSASFTRRTGDGKSRKKSGPTDEELMRVLGMTKAQLDAYAQARLAATDKHVAAQAMWNPESAARSMGAGAGGL